MTEIFCVCSKCGRNVKTHKDVISCLCKDCSNELSSISKGVNQKQADMAQEIWNAWAHDYEMDNLFYYLTFIPDEHLEIFDKAITMCLLMAPVCPPLEVNELYSEVSKAIKKELKRRKNER